MNLFEKITNDTLILTPNRRLSAVLLKEHEEYQLSLGKRIWKTPEILPIVSWIDSLWLNYLANEIDENRIVINTQQELILWEEIIRESPLCDHLLQVSETAKLLKKARDLLKQWSISLNHPLLTLSEDGKVFQEYSAQFQSMCANRNLLTANDILDVIHEKIILPENILLYGFNELPPQQKSFLSACKNLIHHENSNRNLTANTIALNDLEDEIQTMALWAKATITHAKNKNISIGCIVPNLEQSRDRIEQVFKDVFANDFHKINISAGKSLSSYSIIDAALNFLQIGLTPVHIDKISHLLHSPFLGDGEKEKNKRAKYDVYLRSKNKVYVSLDQLLKKYKLKEYCPQLANRISELLHHLQKIKNKNFCSDYVEFFNTTLQILGWPGERSLNSYEYQIVHNAWIPLLVEFTTYDNLYDKPISSSTALHYLKNLAENNLFQPQSPAAPIQILGLLEAAGLNFDYAWICGLDDGNWPPSPKPNPFIPLALQKKFQLPNSTPERELIYSKILMDQLIQNSKYIYFSYSKNLQDLPQRPSSLIKGFSTITKEDLALSHFTSKIKQIYLTSTLETIIDEKAPALFPEENIKGGVKIFEYQAQCPFKAFAELRLFASQIETPKLGLNAKERGTLLHSILEKLWNELKNQNALNAKTNEELINLIEDKINEAMINLDLASNNRYMQIEKVRLQNIILKWLEIEKQRPNFKVISQEQKTQINIENIPINLRIDRIDELEDGTQLLIDYKTSRKIDPNKWFGLRIDEPQIPIYVAFNNQTFSGAAYAQLNAREIKLKGISAHDLNVKGIDLFINLKKKDAESWDSQITTWKQNLTILAQDFLQGNAKVDPKNIHQTCQYCHLKPLCRIQNHADDTEDTALETEEFI